MHIDDVKLRQLISHCVAGNYGAPYVLAYIRRGTWLTDDEIEAGLLQLRQMQYVVSKKWNNKQRCGVYLRATAAGVEFLLRPGVEQLAREQAERTAALNVAAVFDDAALNVERLKQLIKGTFPAEGPWNAVRFAQAMLENGAIPTPVDSTPGQLEIFGTTHRLMVDAAGEMQEAVAGAGLDPEVWKILRRGGVGTRIISAPGESSTVKVVNAMRGERKAWPGYRVEKLWEQLSYPAGLADAVLVLLKRLQVRELEPYRLELLRVIPKLRRCKKASQERRSAR